MTNIENTKLDQIEQLLICLVSVCQKQIERQQNLKIITQKELLTIFTDISQHSKSWEKTGLKRLEPPIEGTRTIYYKMEDVINYLTP